MEYKGKTESGDDIFTVADIGKHSLFLRYNGALPTASSTTVTPDELKNIGLSREDLRCLANGCYIGIKGNDGIVYMLIDASFNSYYNTITIYLKNGGEQKGSAILYKFVEATDGTTWTITRTTKTY